MSDPTSCTHNCLCTSIQAPLTLGEAEDFAVLAYSTVTNTGTTTINGGLTGVCPLTAITGGPIAAIAGPAKSAIAKANIGTAYGEASLRVAGVVGIIEVDVGSTVFTPGLYKTSGALAVTRGDLVLRGKGVFIFQIEQTFQVADNIKIVLEDGAEAGDVFWRVASSATFNSNSEVVGTVMAYASIILKAGAKVEGRLFALNAAVNLVSNSITVPNAPTLSFVLSCDITPQIV
jgi:hypothetical protein